MIFNLIVAGIRILYDYLVTWPVQIIRFSLVALVNIVQYFFVPFFVIRIDHCLLGTNSLTNTAYRK